MLKIFSVLLSVAMTFVNTLTNTNVGEVPPLPEKPVIHEHNDIKA